MNWDTWCKLQQHKELEQINRLSAIAVAIGKEPNYSPTIVIGGGCLMRDGEIFEETDAVEVMEKYAEKLWGEGK